MFLVRHEVFVLLPSGVTSWRQKLQPKRSIEKKQCEILTHYDFFMLSILSFYMVVVGHRIYEHCKHECVLCVILPLLLWATEHFICIRCDDRFDVSANFPHFEMWTKPTQKATKFPDQIAHKYDPSRMNVEDSDFFSVEFTQIYQNANNIFVYFTASLRPFLCVCEKLSLYLIHSARLPALPRRLSNACLAMLYVCVLNVEENKNWFEQRRKVNIPSQTIT